MKVLKPFATRLRRFKVGDEVKCGDNLAPHTVESLQAAGYVETPDIGSRKPARKA